MTDNIQLTVADKKSKTSSRGSRLKVAPEWLEFALGIPRREDGKRKSYKKIAEEITERTGEPHDKSEVGRFAKGELVTDRFLAAFCVTYKTEYPVLSARDPSEIRWFKLGQMLRDQNEATFLEWLEDLDRHTSATEVIDKINLKRKREH